MFEYSESKTYPQSSVIEAKTSSNKFTYRIIQEGIYPNNDILARTLKPNQYKIPDNYIIETTYGKSKTKKTATCFIQYKDNKPEFKIEFQYAEIIETIISSSSPTDAATTYIKRYQKLMDDEEEVATGK